MRLPALLLSSALLFPGLAGCGGSTPEQPDVMVNLTTVKSGPQVQADELDGAITRQPGNGALYARRAAFRLAADQVNEALQDIDKAISLDDTEGEFYFTKARALRAQNRLQSTLKAAAEAARRGYSSPDLTLLLGETHLAARHYQTALDYLDRTLQQDPNHTAALFYKGIAYSSLQDTVQALDYLRASLARDPHQPEVLHQLAFLSNAYRLPADAAQYAARGLKLAPRSGALWYDYGRQFELQGQPDSAFRSYVRAAALDSTLYRADYRIGLWYFQQRRYAAAISPLRRAVRRAPRLPQAREMLAESYESQGQLPAALAQYRQLVVENPGNRRYTFKVWKVGERVRLLQPDTTRARLPRFAPAAPIQPSASAQPAPTVR
ncbi:tetratricopeptide repeat protein [Hymenobacter sp. BT175]|uniref:tetratricopeptide repeat protein n=1 Tax=Hymenobacter translucens TaxID=2886507 RepID=UPI001D0E5BE8|nr:tetratricopeptide repeat protein [Hymenobacter translucens]MCC2544910.1 tetratricopeptide repeat protein [Hymenobacter translucens]